MESRLRTQEDLMPWDCLEFTEAVRNLLKVYKKYTPHTPEEWVPGVITQVNLEMTKEGKAEAEICLRFVGE